MIERLIKILRQAGLEDVTAEEIAEMILLADFLPPPETTVADETPEAPEADEKNGGAAGSASESGPGTSSRPEKAAPRPDGGGLFDQTAREVPEGEGIDVAPFRAPRG